MNIYESLIAKALNGDSGGGGGGDFSTATVTFVADNYAMGGSAYGGAYIINDALAEDVNIPYGTSTTVGVVIYKNQPTVITVDTEDDVTVTGDIVWDAIESQATISGDGTITLSGGK